MPDKRIEVLSPAGSKESLIAAVRSGADAVYLGSKHFSARRNAENFDNSGLEEAVKYCKARGVKVYLALNITVKNSELQNALELARFAHSIGVDAVIIQDIGLASLIHKCCPDLPLHASTQMTVHSPAALSLLKAAGFSRVVVSREMSGQALETFCAKASKLGIETEVFVHGALCMCVSGQCLLSAVLGERSGNRGLCAGPCRLPFKVSGGTGYDLSLKDLSLLDHIKTLEKMGVASLKIEGRMKRPEYIAAATAACRSAVDTGLVPEELSKTLGGVFSRSGFTDGYFTDKLGRDMFGIRTKDDVSASKETFSFLHGLYRTERQSVGVDISAVIKADKRVTLTVSDGVNSVTVSADEPSPALNKAADAESVGASLSKLGGTPFYARNIDVSLDDGLFMSNAVLNALRREAVEALQNKRVALPYVKINDVTLPCGGNSDSRTPKIIACFDDISSIPEDLSGVAAVMLPSSIRPTDKLPQNIPLIAELPRWCEDDERICNKLSELKERGFKAVMGSTLSSLENAKRAGLAFIGGAGLNITNSESLAVMGKMGASAVTVSAELELSSIKRLGTDVKKGIFAYGRMPLMVFKNCPLKNGRSCAECDKKGVITDRLGISFPIRCRGDHSELLNSAYTYLADNIDELRGLDFILLSFTDEKSDRVRKIIDSYISGGKTPENSTRGLYKRGVI